MSFCSDGIGLIVPIVGPDDAERLWGAFREWEDPDVRVQDVAAEFTSALRAWLAVRALETNRDAALSFVEDTVKLMNALNFLTDERHSRLEIWMHNALAELRGQRDQRLTDATP